MAFFDLPLDALRSYRPEAERPDDFDAFWDRTLSEARSRPLEPVFAPVVGHLRTVEVFDLTFSGYGGQRIRGWLLLPRRRDGALPCVVEYIGYGGGRGLPHDWLVWASAGYAHLVMDTRGQGGGWRRGDTPDLPQNDGSSPHAPGFLTLGVLSPESYYYRRLICDAVRAVEAARAFPEVDGERIAVTGVSQGGGLALAVAGLARDEVAVAMPDVPFLCHYRRAIEITDSAPYTEVRQFLRLHRDRVDDVFRTLAYVDGVNFARDATAEALFSVALMDDVCPPSTVFAAYNHYGGTKEIRVYPYNRHEGGESEQTREKLEFLERRFFGGA